MVSASKMDVYEKLMRRAGISASKHLPYLGGSVECEKGGGRVSSAKFDEICEARDFDMYNRLVSQKKKVRRERTKQTVSIAYKDEEFGPPGLARPRSGKLSSEGNERFFEGYAGQWENGKMHGNGTYTFNDGSLYEGRFEGGNESGQGKATYPSGRHDYRGSWKQGKYDGFGEALGYSGGFKAGLRHGNGTLILGSSKYEGSFREGKFHGRGKLTSEGTGYSFEGTFRFGRISGPGSLIFPDGSRESRNWFGDLTLKQAVDLIHQEKRDKSEQRQRDNDVFKLQKKLKLDERVQKIKESLDKARAEEREEAKALKRAKIKSRREASKEKREKAIDALAQAYDKATSTLLFPPASSAKSPDN